MQGEVSKDLITKLVNKDMIYSELVAAQKRSKSPEQSDAPVLHSILLTAPSLQESTN